jgi:hypothetical protein
LAFADGWSFVSDDVGNVKSKRSYILVMGELKNQQQIDVESSCKNEPGEAPFGKCTHVVKIRGSASKPVTLSTGETVVLTGSALAPIATFRYGCCAGPARVTYYSLKGEEVGSLETFVGAPVGFDRPLQIGNYEGGSLFLERKGSTAEKPKYEIVSRDGNGKWTHTPVEVEYQDKRDCLAWTIEHFAKYKDQTDATLSMSSYECDPGTWTGPCRANGKMVKCVLNRKAN